MADDLEGAMVRVVVFWLLVALLVLTAAGHVVVAAIKWALVFALVALIVGWATDR